MQVGFEGGLNYMAVLAYCTEYTTMPDNIICSVQSVKVFVLALYKSILNQSLNLIRNLNRPESLEHCRATIKI